MFTTIALLVVIAVVAYLLFPNLFKSKELSSYAGEESDKCKADILDAQNEKGGVTCIALAVTVQCPNNPNFKYETNPCIAGYLKDKKGWK